MTKLGIGLLTRIDSLENSYLEYEIQRAKSWCRQAILARLQLDKIIADLRKIDYEISFDSDITQSMVLELTMTVRAYLELR